MGFESGRHWEKEDANKQERDTERQTERERERGRERGGI